jgi:malonyl-CoA O-methyltransferase
MKVNDDNAMPMLIQMIGQRLFERLDFLKISPNLILNLSDNAEYFNAQLKLKYPAATIAHIPFEANIPIPLKDQSLEFIFSNGLLQWSSHLPFLLREIKRILKPEGCLLFSTFGPDTSSTMPFIDMHDIGDALVEYQFSDPVMDAEHLQVKNLKAEIIYGLAWNTHEPMSHIPELSHKIPIKIL